MDFTADYFLSEALKRNALLAEGEKYFGERLAPYVELSPLLRAEVDALIAKINPYDLSVLDDLFNPMSDKVAEMMAWQTYQHQEAAKIANSMPELLEAFKKVANRRIVTEYKRKGYLLNNDQILRGAVNDMVTHYGGSAQEIAGLNETSILLTQEALLTVGIHVAAAQEFSRRIKSGDYETPKKPTFREKFARAVKNLRDPKTSRQDKLRWYLPLMINYSPEDVAPYVDKCLEALLPGYETQRAYFMNFLKSSRDAVGLRNEPTDEYALVLWYRKLQSYQNTAI